MRLVALLISAALVSASAIPIQANAASLEEMMRKAKERSAGKSLDELVQEAAKEQEKLAAEPLDQRQEAKGSEAVYARLIASSPSAPAGWSAGDPARDFGSQGLGVDEQISRDYDGPGTKAVALYMGVWQDLAAAENMSHNPLQLGAGEAHQKIVSVSGRNAVLTYDDGGASSLSIFAGRVAITVKGRGLSHDELIAFASRIDFSSLLGI